MATEGDGPRRIETDARRESTVAPVRLPTPQAARHTGACPLVHLARAGPGGRLEPLRPKIAHDAACRRHG